MGAVFFAFFMILILGFGGIIFIVSSVTKNKRIRYVLRIITMLIIGLPTSWIIFLLFVNLAGWALGMYLITINVMGILGNISYRVYLHVFRKAVNIRISRLLNFFLYLSLLSDPFPILLILVSGS